MDWLRSEDAESLAQVVDDVGAGRAGVRRLAHRGRDSLWAYAPIDEVGTDLLIIVPFSGIARAAGEADVLIGEETAQQLAIAGGVSAIMIAVVIVVAVFSARSVTEPVRAVAGAAKRLAGGDLTARVPVSGRDELGELADTFNTMIPQLADRVRVREALALAMEVQQNLLPQDAPSLPGFDIAGHSEYCEDTGGDYFDFIDLSPVANGHLGIAVGDVSGHGVASALLMTTARALLRGRATRPGALARSALGPVMADVNRALAGDVHRGRFMTLLYVVLEPSSLTVRWVDAGHAPAMEFDPGTGTVRDLATGGIPLGVDSDWRYEEVVGTLGGPGTILVIATDGVWESRNPAGAMFGRDALMDVVRAHAGEPAQAICDAVMAACAEHRAGRPASDDTTLVIVKATD